MTLPILESEREHRFRHKYPCGCWLDLRYEWYDNVGFYFHFDSENVHLCKTHWQKVRLVGKKK